jgi:hypothetical protein
MTVREAIRALETMPPVAELFVECGACGRLCGTLLEVTQNNHGVVLHTFSGAVQAQSPPRGIW